MTTHTKEQRLAIAKAFEKARELLLPEVPDEYRSPKERFIYICLCLDEVGEQDRSLAKAAQASKDVIGERLGTCFSFDSWLYGRVPYAELSLDTVCNRKRKHQATRRAWLDSLIEEFSS